MEASSSNHADTTPDASGGPQTALAEHIIAFGRTLRRAGLKIGSSQIMDAIEAVHTVGVKRRDDLRQALFSILVQTREDAELFEQAFHYYWRTPSDLNEMMAAMLPSTQAPDPGQQPRQRVLQALQEPEDEPEPPDEPDPLEDGEMEVEIYASYSATEAIQEKDFAEFSADEMMIARAFIEQMTWPVEPQHVRRRSRTEKGRLLDMRQTVRNSLRSQGELLNLAYQGRKRKPRPIVVLSDISGSMEPYARMLLHFMYAITEGMHRVESFVFGTQLTRVTRMLRQRDIDQAIEEVSEQVNDWSGGTRIGEALKTFNYVWLRRVLRSGGVVLIISDGCDRGDIDLMDAEMARLSRNCHRLMWLNPLLRYDGYEPLTRGMQAAMPYIDDFLPVHNLRSLQQLGRVLSDAAYRSSSRPAMSFTTLTE